MAAHLGSNVTLAAMVSGNRSDLLWYVKWWSINDDLPDPTELKFTKQSTHAVTLTLNNLHYDHQGKYHASVSNDYFNEQSSDVCIQVHGKLRNHARRLEDCSLLF